MAKKQNNTNESLDELIRKALLTDADGQPRKAKTKGKLPGLFPAGKGGDPLLARALELGYVEKCESPPKVKDPYVRVTPKGHDWARRETAPREILEGLLTAFRRQEDLVRPKDEVNPLRVQLDALKGTFEQVQQALAGLQFQLETLRSNFERTEESIKRATQEQKSERNPLLSTLQSARAALERLSGEGGEVSSPPAPDLSSPAEAFVRRWEQEKRTNCPLPELFAHLQQHNPSLSIGAFHDLLRTLHHSGRVRLGSWSKPLDRLSDPKLALIISREVMYDAHIPDQR